MVDLEKGRGGGWARRTNANGEKCAQILLCFGQEMPTVYICVYVCMNVCV